MGPMYWMPQSPTKLLKCSERKSNSCDLTETDGCCAIIPCTLCLEFFVAPGTYSYGEAPFASSSWSGSVAGAAFVAYWEQDYQSGECEFIVAVDGIIVYRKSCYEGADCRDPSGSTTVTIGSDSGTLSWSVYESRPLEYIQDPDTNCRTYFCDDCDCSCECLCVTVTPEGGSAVSGDICDTAYACDAPLWEGEVGGIALSVALDRDQYGQCVIVVTADGEEQPPVLFPGCSNALATVTLGGGTTLAFSCKKCSCEEEQLSCCSCDATYVGCTAATVADDCLNDSIAGDVWSTTASVPYPHNDWGTVECNWFWTQNFVLSREGCSPVETAFHLFQVTAPSAFAESLGVQACDWVLEIWADNVYQGYVLEFARECIFEVETASNTLDWVQFYNVPVPGTSAEITLTMVRYESPSDLCVPTGRP